MNTFFLILSLLATPAAHAGKLADGYRGIPFGGAEAVKEKPLPSCIRGEDPVRWTCDTTLGGMPVNVGFMVESGIYSHYLIFFDLTKPEVRMGGSADDALKQILDNLSTVWGEPADVSDKMGEPAIGWTDGPVSAALIQRGDALVLTVLHETYGRKQIRAKKEKLHNDI